MSTIRDVARLAGVSTATVSHVVNNSRRVNAETRQAVLDAIGQLNYRPSGVARSLTTSKTRSVGVLVADITNPFFASLVRGIEDRLSEQDYNLIVCNTDEQSDKEARYLELLLARRVDGMIVAPTGQPQPLFQEIVQRDIPLIFIDRFPQEKYGPVVAADNFAAGYAAARHLIELGHCRIAILARHPALSTVIGRVGGYRQALADHSIPVEESLIALIDSNEQAAFLAAQELLYRPDRPTACIATNLHMTLGVVRAFRALHLDCPDDVSLVCFDDQLWAPHFTPPLSVIRQPIAQMCDAAVHTLLQAIEHSHPEGPASTPTTLPDAILPAEFIDRLSCKRIA